MAEVVRVIPVGAMVSAFCTRAAASAGAEFGKSLAEFGKSLACFPGDATVRMKDGTTKHMRDVKIGDVIWDGHQFTEVFFLSRADEVQAANYVTISAGEASMRCTTGHLVAVLSSGGKEELKASENVQTDDFVKVTTPCLQLSQNQWRKLQKVLEQLSTIDHTNGKIETDDIIIALEMCESKQDSAVRVHDLIQACSPEEGRIDPDKFLQLAQNGVATWCRVDSVCISPRAMDGTFNPLTLTGMLAVDNIVCSAYTVTNPPERFIPATAPVRKLYQSQGPTAVQTWSDKCWDLTTSRPKGWMEKSVPAIPAESLPPSERELSSTPTSFNIKMTTRIGGAVHYVLDCELQDGKKWTVAKRYSRCKGLRDVLVKDIPSIATVPFPPKAIFSQSEATTDGRQIQLAEWLNRVLAIEPDVATCAAMYNFLSEDRVKRVCLV